MWAEAYVGGRDGVTKNNNMREEAARAWLLLLCFH